MRRIGKKGGKSKAEQDSSGFRFEGWRANHCWTRAPSTETGGTEERMLGADLVREMGARQERGEGIKRIARELGRRSQDREALA